MNLVSFKLCPDYIELNPDYVKLNPEYTKLNPDYINLQSFSGVLLLTSLLLNTVRHTPNSHLIFVSSEAHRLVSVRDVETFDPRESVHVKNFDDHVRLYGISKLALRVFAQFVAERFPGECETCFALNVCVSALRFILFCQCIFI